MKKFSVVIPAYNSDATIIRALDSVASQTFRDFEIVVVDDASRDQTVRLVKEWALRNMSVTLQVFDANGGAAKARNAGISAATAPWIAFLDSDDAWHPRKLEYIALLITKYPQVDVWGGRCCLGFSAQEIEFDALSVRLIGTASPQVFFSNPYMTPAVVARKTPALHFDEGHRYAEDYKLWLSLFSNSIGAVIEPSLAFIFKDGYGVSGLSASLVRMELGELRALACFWRRRPVVVSLALLFSFVKFLRRVCLVAFRGEA